MPQDRWVGELAARLARFKRAVIWGHPLGSHTHSYIHLGFAKALVSIGVETVWTDDPLLLERTGVAQTLFLTEGQVVAGLPRERSCRYVLHNVDRSWYEEIADCVLLLQAYTVDAELRSLQATTCQRLNSYTWVDVDDHGTPTLYQPWASDLLPDEFDFALPTPELAPGAYAAWVGTIGGGAFGNAAELAGFQAAAGAAGVEFVHREGLSRSAHRRLVAGSVVAPAIVGAWQLRKGYLPCRVFKNISYGRLGLTNSPAVAGIFDPELPWSSDSGEVFAKGVELLGRRDLLTGQMCEVQARHTFLNRLDAIVSCLP
ncbi:MAG TPA: hypothetical protein VMD59_07660 [Acidimicrobiales bacterium]|nr:hypothetical protein [Acidimicrobiales bacterium]